MPAHPKTTDLQIIQAARALLEHKGRDGFSMKDVAAAVHIRTPSLYGRFKDRADLLSAVDLQVWAELADLLSRSIVADDATATLMAQARAIRRFALGNPNGYSLFFDARLPPTDTGTAARGAAVGRLLEPLGALVGKERAFASARVLVPFLHGFISMELANGFRLGDGVDAAFENGLSVILRGLVSEPPLDDED
jgi:AcrR family transcriptional regulator